MGCFGILVDDNKQTKDFIVEIEENMKRIKDGIVPIFDKVGIRSYKTKDDKILIVINMQFYFYNFAYVGIALSIFSYILGGLSGWVVLGVLIALTGLFHWEYFYFIMFRLGIKKKKIVTEIKYINKQELLSHVVFNQ